MSKVGICIPWRSTPSRAPLLPVVLAHYRDTVPDAEHYLADSGHAVFNRSASFNLAVRGATDDGCDIVVVGGADQVLDGDLPAVIRQCAEDGRAHIAHSYYAGLSRIGTRTFLRTRDWRRCKTDYETDGCCAGFVVLPAALYWELGGHDEKFVGWGYEDVDFAIRGQFVKHSGTMVALWHAADGDKDQRGASNAEYFRAKHGGC